MSSACSATIFLRLIDTFLIKQCVLDPSLQYPADYAGDLVDNAEFDFIVVGGGAAGSVVANRLSENPEINVLLIEAGGFPISDSEVPGFWPYLFKSEIDWRYETEPSDKACNGFTNSRCTFTRGKVLGGSSALNYNVYLRGTAKNYNDWESSGNPGWNWKDSLRYFKKSENCRSAKFTSGGLHGTKGPLSTFYFRDSTYRKVLFTAAKQAGYPILEDEGNGFFESLVTVDAGKSLNVARAYLSPIKSRRNLKVALNSFVTKILIEDSTAIGVEVHVNEQRLRIKAKMEVVLSAGVVNSPQLLMLSGLGPKGHLSEFKINVVKDLPVGLNFQDHVTFYGFWVKMNKPVAGSQDNLEILYEYCRNHTGPLAYLPGVNILNQFSTKGEANPNVQVWYWPFYKGDYAPITSAGNFLNMNEQTSKYLIQLNQEHELLLIGSVILTPKSRGSIKLQYAEPMVPPKIEAGYLSDQEDVKTLLQAIAHIKTFVKQAAFQERKAELVDIKIPNCEKHQFNTDDYWECAIRNVATSNFDGCGTCGMGPEGVVDETLKVRGIQNLRVIDASVIPVIPAGGLLAASVMVAEKGADLITDELNL